jgi:transposase
MADGLCVFSKRLESGHFVWPEADSGKIHLTQAQLSMLLEHQLEAAFPNAHATVDVVNHAGGA